jgi:2-methylcitrate dehydratase PrpD
VIRRQEAFGSVDADATHQLTRYVANCCVALRTADIPEPVTDEAIRHLVDGYGVAVASAKERCHQMPLEPILSSRAENEAFIVGTRGGSSTESAALLLGLAIHAQDFDDISISDAAQVHHRLRPSQRVPDPAGRG